MRIVLEEVLLEPSWKIFPFNFSILMTLQAYQKVLLVVRLMLHQQILLSLRFIVNWHTGSKVVYWLTNLVIVGEKGIGVCNTISTYCLADW